MVVRPALHCMMVGTRQLLRVVLMTQADDLSHDGVTRLALSEKCSGGSQHWEPPSGRFLRVPDTFRSTLGKCIT